MPRGAQFCELQRLRLYFCFPSGAEQHMPQDQEILSWSRRSDEPAYNTCLAAGHADCYTPEFLKLISQLNPKTLRTMGWSGTVNSNEVELELSYHDIFAELHQRKLPT